MYLDEQSVGACGNRGQRHRSDKVAVTCALAGIGDNRQVRKPFDERDGADIHRVARHLLEGANTTLTKNDVVIAL